jgi:hypothetical protein
MLLSHLKIQNLKNTKNIKQIKKNLNTSPKNIVHIYLKKYLWVSRVNTGSQIRILMLLRPFFVLPKFNYIKIYTIQLFCKGHNLNLPDIF